MRRASCFRRIPHYGQIKPATFFPPKTKSPTPQSPASPRLWSSQSSSPACSASPGGFRLSAAGCCREIGLSKRKQPYSTVCPALTEHEKTLYNLIRSKQDMGIWSKDLKQEAKIPENAAIKALKALISKGLVKEVVNVQFKGRKHCMAVEFEPSAEITGGPWYNQGSLDTEFIDIMKDQCLRQIRRLGVATVDMVADEIKKSKILKADYPVQQIGEIVKALALDNDVVEVKSTGIGEFPSIHVNKVSYKCIRLPGASREPKAGALASVPCGVCPHLRECTTDGIISPSTCVYFTKWLDF